MHLLHGLIKKTQKTPANDYKVARQRMKTLQRYDDAKST